MNNNYELEGAIPPASRAPTGNILDVNIMQPMQVAEENETPHGSPRVKEPYKVKLKKVYRK